MMAVRAPLGLSPSSNALFSAFSPFSEHPDSPRPLSATAARPNMSSGYRESGLRASYPPTSATSTSATSASTTPSSAVAPSPIYSEAGTEFVDVDEEVDSEAGSPKREETQQPAQKTTPPPQSIQHSVAHNTAVTSPLQRSGLPPRPGRPTSKLSLNTGTALAFNVQNPPEEIEPQSVIHVPTGFGTFDKSSQLVGTPPREEEPIRPVPAPLQPSDTSERPRADSTDSRRSDSTVTVGVLEPARSQRHPHEFPIPPTPLQTTLPLGQDWSSTPRAQTRSDLGAFSRPGSSLDSIQERDDIPDYSGDSMGEDSDGYRPGLYIRSAEDEIAALRAALSECWTLCNTLAGLSYIHRQKMFEISGAGDMQQIAWKSCWKLCQNLYDTQQGRVSTAARPTLDLCREFCQALFDVRVRDNETADSVLRVSFELTNHLFNTHDRNLPEAFRERTLDFYITLCHRLMKQKARMAQETDSLLRACWSLAEMLFSLRQNKRENKKADDELLGSAVQACWELCDLFREGWTQIRPERGTPRPSQPTFTQAYNQAKRAGFAPLDENGNPKPLPETPTTLFEETINMISPDDPPPQPNILVLGAQANIASRSSMSSSGQQSQANMSSQRGPMSAHPTNRRQWPSIGSTQSESVASEAFKATSAASAATAKGQPPREDPALTILRVLFIKAAITTNRGYTRTSADPNLNNLSNFVRNLPESAFGTQVWQVSLLENYQKAVGNDSNFMNLGTATILAERGRVNSVEVARAVKGMTSCVYGFGWLRDLYRYVFGFYVEEALKGEDGGTSGGESSGGEGVGGGSSKGGMAEKLAKRNSSGGANGAERRSQSLGAR